MGRSDKFLALHGRSACSSVSGARGYVCVCVCHDICFDGLMSCSSMFGAAVQGPATTADTFAWLFDRLNCLRRVVYSGLDIPVLGLGP